MNVGAGEPNPEEARAAIAQAARAEVPVRSQDRLFAIRLFALASSVVFASILIVGLVAMPSVLGPLEGILAGLGIAAGILMVVAAGRRQQAFSRSGNRLFVATLLFWILWAEVIWQGSWHSDWLAYALPHAVRALHFVLTAVVMVVPLLAGAVVFRFRR